jgi:hypothetical protein
MGITISPTVPHRPPLVSNVVSNFNGVVGRPEEASSCEANCIQSVLSFPSVRKRRFRHPILCEEITALWFKIKLITH